MLSNERRKEIMDILREKGEVSTKYLEKKLDVTGATIRNDLTKLEEENKIKRVHGGATLLEGLDIPNSYIDLHIRSKKNILEKKAIAKVAKKLIEDNDTLFFDASSTVLYLIPELKNIENLTVITNGIFTALTLKQYLDNNVLLLGGSVRKDSGAIEGLLSDDILDDLHGDIMFTSAHGFSLEEGLTDYNLYEVELKKKMVEKAKKLVAVIDHTKINNISTTSFAKIDQIDTLITDKYADQEIIKKIEKAGVEVLLADHNL